MAPFSGAEGAPPAIAPTLWMGDAADRHRSWPAACHSERHERGGADPPQLVEEPDGAQCGAQRHRELFDWHAEHHRHPRHPSTRSATTTSRFTSPTSRATSARTSTPSASWNFCPRSVRPTPSSNSSRKEKREKRGALLPAFLIACTQMRVARARSVPVSRTSPLPAGRKRLSPFLALTVSPPQRTSPPSKIKSERKGLRTAQRRLRRGEQIDSEIAAAGRCPPKSGVGTPAVRRVTSSACAMCRARAFRRDRGGRSRTRGRSRCCLLHLCHHDAAADGVDGARGDEHCVARLDVHAAQDLGKRVVRDAAL